MEKDGPMAPETTLRNEMYKQMQLNKKIQNESFIERGVQTFNNALKTKEVQIAPPKRKDVGIVASEWDIYDSFNQIDHRDER